MAVCMIPCSCRTSPKCCSSHSVTTASPIKSVLWSAYRTKDTCEPRTSAGLIRMPREKTVRSQRGKPVWYMNRFMSPGRPRALPTSAQSASLVITGLTRARACGPGQGAGPGRHPGEYGSKGGRGQHAAPERVSCCRSSSMSDASWRDGSTGDLVDR